MTLCAPIDRRLGYISKTVWGDAACHSAKVLLSGVLGAESEYQPDSSEILCKSRIGELTDGFEPPKGLPAWTGAEELFAASCSTPAGAGPTCGRRMPIDHVLVSGNLLPYVTVTLGA